ncbi:MAG: sarcosine oxidase subunit gamma [Pseudomonadota bacterium]
MLEPTARLGTDLTIGANRITERTDLALYSVAIPRDGESALADALQTLWNLALPTPKQSTQSANTRALRTAPDALLLILPEEAPVAAKLQGSGYITDQTHGLTVLDVSGPDTPSALERLCPLDLSPEAFPEGATARTLVEQLGTTLLRLGDTHFLLISASSSAESTLHAVETAYHSVA